MPKTVACLVLFVPFHSFVASGEGIVLCVGDSGHQRIERASAPCCVSSPSTREAGMGWSGDDPCGPCTDYAGAGAAVSSDPSRSHRHRDCVSLDLSTGMEPTLFPEAAMRRASLGERRIAARTHSPLRV